MADTGHVEFSPEYLTNTAVGQAITKELTMGIFKASKIVVAPVVLIDIDWAKVRGTRVADRLDNLTATEREAGR